jgi:polyisoprenoid-binding protein YceI
LDANTVNTANDYRDKTIKGADFFNVSKYRRITFKSTAVKTSNSGYEVVGDLTIAGVTKSVVLEAETPAPPQ